jgi:Uma2 family endonuclease
VEVLSADDRWSRVRAKAGEYLEAGVSILCIVDPKTESVHLHHADRAPHVLKSNDDLTFPEVLGDFRVPVAKLFG